MRLKKQKRGIELSVNFLVMLILGLAIFSVGLYIANEVFTKSYQQAKVLDDDIKFAIENDLRDISQEVSIGLHRKTSERGGSGSFGIGIANRDDDPHVYTVIKTFKTHETELSTTGSEITFPTIGQDLSKITLKPHETKILTLPFFVKKDAFSGIYSYQIIVEKNQPCDDTGCNVGKVQRIYVEVK